MTFLCIKWKIHKYKLLQWPNMRYIFEKQFYSTCPVGIGLGWSSKWLGWIPTAIPNPDQPTLRILFVSSILPYQNGNFIIFQRCSWRKYTKCSWKFSETKFIKSKKNTRKIKIEKMWEWSSFVKSMMKTRNVKK